MPPRKATPTKKTAAKKAAEKTEKKPETPQTVEVKPPEPAPGTAQSAIQPTEKASQDVPKSKKSISDVAKEVIAGDWGIGQDRRLRLSAAGYNVEKVKEEVTRQLNTRT